jgi:hypothetical protein
VTCTAAAPVRPRQLRLSRQQQLELFDRHRGGSTSSSRAPIVIFLPELSEEDAYQIVAIALLMTSAAWPHSQRSEALLTAYAEHPDLAATQTDFEVFVRQTLELTITGLQARRDGFTV